MGRPRSEVVIPHEVGCYHCVTRCTRQLFLLGYDPASESENLGRWSFCESQLEFLAGVFAVDILDYALLSNHVHTVIRIRPDIARRLSKRELAWRWLTLHPGEKLKDGTYPEVTDEAVKIAMQNDELMAKARKKLCCLSYFQKNFLEPIAKEMNFRDNVQGHFVAERFRCKRIEDEAALLVCSVYVSLNPFRAGLETSIEAHPHASYSRRYRKTDTWISPLFLDERAQAYADVTQVIEEDGKLVTVSQSNPFPSPRISEKGFLPLTWTQYQVLVAWTATHLRPGQKTTWRDQPVDVPAEQAQILQKIGVTPELWLDTVAHFEELFYNFVGMPQQLSEIARKLEQKFVKGQRACAARFVPRPTTDEGGGAADAVPT